MSNIDNKEVEGIEIKKYNQFRYDFEDYMIKYVIPDVVAHQLAQAYYRDCLSKISLKRHYTCMSDVFNIFPQLEDVKDDIIDILKMKYDLTIIREDPLMIDKWRK